jgi:hypothetical protein
LESVTTMSRIGCASPRRRRHTRSSRTAAAPQPRSPERAHRRVASQAGIGDDNPERLAQRLTQRDREREARQPAAADQNVVFSAPAMSVPP